MKHGGDLSEAIARFGGAPDSWLDLSTGINPWPYPVPGKLPSQSWQRLPERVAEEQLIEAARAAYKVPAGVGIAPAAGTQVLIQILPHLIARGTVAIVGPTYSEHAAAFARAGHRVLSITSLKALPQEAAHAVIVNPNNPDGQITDRSAIATAARVLTQRGGRLVIDEAFADVEPDCSSVEISHYFPIVVLRSFGKFFGLAGLRLGFAIGRTDLVAEIATALGPWSVSGPALFIGRTALSDHAWIATTRGRLHQQMGRLDTVLRAADCKIIGGTSLFRLARHPDAQAIHARLAGQQIWTRSFDHAGDLLRFGLPPDDSALQRLAAALTSHSTAR
jgi:cobalamin biosynthetic protein CobC